jgi:integrase
MIFFPGKQSIGDECAELYKKKIDIYQHYLNYMTYTAMRYFVYKTGMLGHQSPELERKIANTRFSYERLRDVESRYINLKGFCDYGIRDFNDKQEMNRVAIDELDAIPRPIRKLEIRYVEKEEVVAFAGILQFFSIIEPGKFLNVYEATFFQTIPAHLEKEEFIKKAQVVIDDFDEDDYNFIINDFETLKKLTGKPKKR